MTDSEPNDLPLAGPAEPAAARPLPPADMLAYSSLQRLGRPGIVTTVGVLSICFGGLGVLTNAFGVFQAIVMGVAARSGGAAFAVVPPPPVVAATAPAGAMPATAPAATMPTTAPVVMTGMFDLSTLSIVLSVASAVVAFLLSAFLLVLGIMVLMDAPRARRGHLLYAWLRIASAVLAAVATFYMYTEMFDGMTAAGGTGGMPPRVSSMIGLVAAAGSAVFACIYPVALLIVMHTRTVRDYYARLTSGRAEDDYRPAHPLG